MAVTKNKETRTWLARALIRRVAAVSLFYLSEGIALMT
jgi:hypothetical protein